MSKTTLVPDEQKPLIGISCCNSNVGIHKFHMVAEKYITAAMIASNAIPVLIPAMGNDMLSLLPHLDGLYLTGSYSNIEPIHYNEDPLDNSDTNETRDRKRDNTNLTLIKDAYDLGMPILGVCRGFQEMNVALGGSLHQCLSNKKNQTNLNHNEDKSLKLAQQYAIAHNVKLTRSGLLDSIMKGELNQQVNSLHGQGINALAPLLKVEAVAPDGLIEAFSLKDNKSFFLGVQWHPEWNVNQHPFYAAIFNSFGQASLSYKLKKASPNY